MNCAICGIRIDSVDEAIEEGWCPYFFDGDNRLEPACPSCAEALLQEGVDGEMQVKEEYQGKMRFLDERGDEAWQNHSHVVMAVLENEPGKLN